MHCWMCEGLGPSKPFGIVGQEEAIKVKKKVERIPFMITNELCLTRAYYDEQ